MKTQILQKYLAVVAVAGSVLLAANANAQTAATPQLSYGVSEISQLAQAKVGDNTIIAYIKNSGISYGLDANQIVYLRQQGVSDAVITTMLSQPKPVVATVPAPTAASVPLPATPAPQVASTVNTAATTTTVAPTVTYVQTVPTTTYYYAPQPYYYPTYYSGWAPNVSLSFGFGGYYGGRGCYYGGWHGGYGGGWHGHR